jgi:hypothetical protein
MSKQYAKWQKMSFEEHISASIYAERHRTIIKEKRYPLGSYLDEKDWITDTLNKKNGEENYKERRIMPPKLSHSGE